MNFEIKLVIDIKRLEITKYILIVMLSGDHSQYVDMICLVAYIISNKMSRKKKLKFHNFTVLSKVVI